MTKILFDTVPEELSRKVDDLSAKIDELNILLGKIAEK